jgi:hypothetical protein
MPRPNGRLLPRGDFRTDTDSFSVFQEPAEFRNECPTKNRFSPSRPASDVCLRKGRQVTRRIRANQGCIRQRRIPAPAYACPLLQKVVQVAGAHADSVYQRCARVIVKPMGWCQWSYRGGNGPNCACVLDFEGRKILLGKYYGSVYFG